MLMKINYIIYIIFSAVFLLHSCNAQEKKDTSHIEKRSITTNGSEAFLNQDTSASTLHKRFSVPEGFERIELDSNSFGYYLRTIPLKPHGSVIHYFDGRQKLKPDVYCAVIDQQIDPVDLQQCADAVMRLRGEYLYHRKKYASIHFNFLSDNKPHYYTEYCKGDYSYKKFRSYMRYVFSYANTASLKNELVPVEDANDIQPGDVFIQSGNPYGHAVIVMDVAENNEGKKVFMLAQSYMPAQETQILIDRGSGIGSPWYELGSEKITTPEWPFKKSDLRRFKVE